MINYKAQFLYKDETSEWKSFKWIIFINGENFEYSTGEGHFTPYTRRAKLGIERNKKPDNSIIASDLEGWIYVPQLDDILESLFLDASVSQESFYDFCDNCGYDRDSLKAFTTYKACLDNSIKLKKALGDQYNNERKRIEDKNE